MEIWVYVVLFLQPRDVEKVQLNLQLCDRPTHTQQQKKRKKRRYTDKQPQQLHQSGDT